MNEVQVWVVDLTSFRPGWKTLSATLSAAELRRITLFKHDTERQRFARCRFALRHILSRELLVPATRIRIMNARWGKPVVEGRTRPAFNVAHSRDTALIATSSHADVGIDIERIRPLAAVESLARFVFSPEEQQQLLAANDKSIAFLRGWTRKEAVLKAVGTGLAVDPYRFSVSLGAQPFVGAVCPEGGRAWTLVDLDIPRHVAAVAVRASAADVCVRPFVV